MREVQHDRLDHAAPRAAVAGGGFPPGLVDQDQHGQREEHAADREDRDREGVLHQPPALARSISLRTRASSSRALNGLTT